MDDLLRWPTPEPEPTPEPTPGPEPEPQPEPIPVPQWNDKCNITSARTSKNRSRLVSKRGT
jgi:hypothetical protein